MVKYIFCLSLGHIVGVVMGVWWTSPDVKRLRATVIRLEKENEKYRRHILRDYKVKMWSRGVEVDPDDA